MFSRLVQGGGVAFFRKSNIYMCNNIHLIQLIQV